jgi:AGZA family xanthine/uracil permease-like MFS transporter
VSDPVRKPEPGPVRKPDPATEAIAGVTTFFTMAYIVVVNPSILSTPGTGIPFSGAMTATVLVCFTLTMLMGLYARLPFAVAPGMGVNGFFTFNLILSRHIPWPVALGMVFWAGVLFLVLSVTPVREAIVKAIPQGLRSATAVGIGVFLTFIGLRNTGLVAADPVTLVRLGVLDHRTLLMILGLAVTLWFSERRNPLAYLAGILSVTAVAVAAGMVQVPAQLFSAPDFQSVFLKLDPWGALRLALVPAIVSLMFTDLFDSLSTLIGVAQASNMLDKDGNPVNLKQGLIVDSFATLGAGLFGTSSGTAYIESAAGISAGGRTGLTSVVTALCFLPCFFVAPLAGMVPAYATAPVLILIGAAMFRSVAAIDFTRLEDGLPAFLTIVLIPLTFSITQGILWGFISHVGLYCLAGRRREVHPVMYVLAAISVGLLVLEHSPLS